MIKQINIQRLGINGEGVGYLDGMTVFVDGALPGELVDVRIYEQHKRYARAKVVNTLTLSPHRKTPPCPLFGTCGGCQIMHLDEEVQLKTKTERVVDALQRIGKLDVDVQPCISSPSALHYRNKIQLPIRGGDPLRIGLYAQNSHDLVEIDDCKIHCPLGDQAFQKVKMILKNAPISEEIFKTLLIKTAISTQQVLVILVTQGTPELASIAQQILESMPEIKGVVQNIHDSSNNVILGKTFRTLAGQGSIEEKLSGLYFKVSPASFFQVNPAQAEKLYQKALELADLKGEEKVLDAYCGVGTLSLILAQRAKEVIGVECVSDAIRDAQENARRNQINNVRFVCDKAEDFISTLKNVDVAVINPPRKGCESNFLEKLSALAPERIVYISCDPATLARDLAFLCCRGYKVDHVQPFDMFPQTAHVECVVSLLKSN